MSVTTADTYHALRVGGGRISVACGANDAPTKQKLPLRRFSKEHMQCLACLAVVGQASLKADGE